MLTLREQRNFQFDFLRPQHSLFQYFTKLLEQYTNLEDQDHGGVGGVGMPQGKQKLQHENIFFKVGLFMIRTPWPTTT